MALSWEDAKNFAKSGGYEAYGSEDNWVNQGSPSVPTPNMSYYTDSSEPDTSPVYGPSIPKPPSSNNNAPADWMGNAYQPVNGTNWWSTNPSNPNAPKYNYDGTPVPTVNYNNQVTGQYYDGYATPEQFQQLMNTSNNSEASSQLISNWLNSGQLGMSNDNIYKNVVPPPTTMIGGSTITNDDTSSDQDYYSSVPMPPTNTTTTPGTTTPGTTTPGTTAPGASTGVPVPPESIQKVMDMDAIRKYAEDQVKSSLASARSSADQQINAGKNATAQQLAALQTSYDRLKTTIGEDRTLQNNQFDRLNNPFSGATDYAKGITNMQRERSDREMNENLLTNKNNANANLTQLQNEIEAKYAALESASPAQQEALIREIKNDERNYDLMLRGELRADTLASDQLKNSEFNRNLQEFNKNYQVQRDAISDSRYNNETAYNRGRDQRADLVNDRNFNYGVGRDQVADQRYTDETNYNRGQDQVRNDQAKSQNDLMWRQQRIKEAADLSAKYGVPVDPKEDYSLVLDQIRGLTPVAEKTAQQQREDALRSDAWKVVEFLGTVPEPYADLLGVPAGTQSQRAKEFAAEQAYRQRALSVDERNAATSERNAGLREKEIQNQANKPQKPATYKENPEYSQELQFIYSNPNTAVKEIQDNVQALIQVYGNDGYNELLKEAQRVQKAAQG